MLRDAPYIPIPCLRRFHFEATCWPCSAALCRAHQEVDSIQMAGALDSRPPCEGDPKWLVVAPRAQEVWDWLNQEILGISMVLDPSDLQHAGDLVPIDGSWGGSAGTSILQGFLGDFWCFVCKVHKALFHRSNVFQVVGCFHLELRCSPIIPRIISLEDGMNPYPWSSLA